MSDIGTGDWVVGHFPLPGGYGRSWLLYLILRHELHMKPGIEILILLRSSLRIAKFLNSIFGVTA